MDQENQKLPEKVVEKYYIEVSPSKWNRFITGLLGGAGYGVGLTLGTSIILILIGLLVSKINFVPVLGNFLASVIQSAQGHLQAK